MRRVDVEGQADEDRGRETGVSVFRGTWADFGLAPALRQTRPGSQSLLLALPACLPAWHLPASRERRARGERILLFVTLRTFRVAGGSVVYTTLYTTLYSVLLTIWNYANVMLR